MIVESVSASDSIDMIGPYLALKAICPFCKQENILTHLESIASSVKPVWVCSHIRSVEWDKDMSRSVQFARTV